MLRSAAIGVRSSCEASAIRWRWASTERSSASSVWLKLAARRRSSAAPVSSIRRGLVELSGHVLGTAEEALDRRQRRAGYQDAQQERQYDPAPDQQTVGAVTVRGAPSPPPSAGAPPGRPSGRYGSPAVSTSTCIPRTVVEVKKLPWPAAGDPEHACVDGQSHRLAVRARTPARPGRRTGSSPARRPGGGCGGGPQPARGFAAWPAGLPTAGVAAVVRLQLRYARAARSSCLSSPIRCERVAQVAHDATATATAATARPPPTRSAAAGSRWPPAQDHGSRST